MHALSSKTSGLNKQRPDRCAVIEYSFYWYRQLRVRDYVIVNAELWVAALLREFLQHRTWSISWFTYYMNGAQIIAIKKLRQLRQHTILIWNEWCIRVFRTDYKHKTYSLYLDRGRHSDIWSLHRCGNCATRSTILWELIRVQVQGKGFR